MSAPVIIQRFAAPGAEPFELEALDANFAALVAAVNALAAAPLLQLGVTPGNDPSYLPITGGTLYGQVTAPSVLIGPPGGPHAAAVSVTDIATTALAGVVKQATAVADLAQSITNPPTQAEVQAIQAKVNALLAALRVAGVLAP